MPADERAQLTPRDRLKRYGIALLTVPVVVVTGVFAGHTAEVIFLKALVVSVIILLIGQVWGPKDSSAARRKGPFDDREPGLTLEKVDSRMTFALVVSVLITVAGADSTTPLSALLFSFLLGFALMSVFMLVVYDRLPRKLFGSWTLRPNRLTAISPPA